MIFHGSIQMLANFKEFNVENKFNEDQKIWNKLFIL